MVKGFHNHIHAIEQEGDYSLIISLGVKWAFMKEQYPPLIAHIEKGKTYIFPSSE